MSATQTLAGGHRSEELYLASSPLGRGLRHNDLSVPGIRCGGCIRKIEKAFADVPGVVRARVNLSTKRVAVDWRESEGPPPLQDVLGALGYDAYLQDTDREEKDPEYQRLIRALAVAGFGMMNIMAFSVGIWSGASGETRNLFHWISAAIALPVLFYSGRVFFASAWRALRHGTTNMDVPISIGVLLAFAISFYDTLHGAPHAYFDASVSLLFFLLIGRTLDHMMREKARTAVKGLGRLAARGATIIAPDGRETYVPIDRVEPGAVVLLSIGDRVPVDGVIVDGKSDIDQSLVSGESAPIAVQTGSVLRAGTLNLTGPIRMSATAAARDSFLAEMIRLMEAAEGGRSRYRRLADRAASLYAPVVHSAAFLAFLGWMFANGDWHHAITIAVSVLIITCPCALGLAVPMVQVVAAKRLFERGVMVKDGSGLERLQRIDTILFDKTGTLTFGVPRVRNIETVTPRALAIAAALGARSRHPYAQALARAGEGQPTDIGFADIHEQAGFGLEGRDSETGDLWRLGRANWALSAPTGHENGTILSQNGALVQEFLFADMPRPGAREAIGALHAGGIQTEILSGDRAPAVEAIAKELGIGTVAAGLLPAEKIERVTALRAEGRQVLMVGDGLNDTPALAAADVSMAPGSAADVGRQAADFVFLHPGLDSVPFTLGIARRANRLIRQNFAFAVLYNMIALPAAVAGYVTPLVAALAMSGSSIVVVANALRLNMGGGRRAADPD